MEKIITLFLVMYMTTSLSQAKTDKEPFCLSCQEKQLNADVFVVLTNGIWENQIVGQFYRIAGPGADIAMSLQEIMLFMKSSGAQFVRYGGYAYVLYENEKKLELLEAVRDEKTGDIVLLKKSMQTLIEKNLSFFNLIIPRKDYL